MVNEKPDVAAAGRYSIKETCAKLGISRTSLYKYDRTGNIRHKTYRSTLRRYYEGKEILKFWADSI